MYIKPLMPTGIPVNVPLMPQYFKDAGYTTHAIGKWHLGHCHQNYTPTYRGFDSFYGFYLGSQVGRMCPKLMLMGKSLLKGHFIVMS